MSEENRKREAAIRLFGALSGVDEEYLAGCEADTAQKGGARKKIAPAGFGRFVRKHGTAAAAVLCVAVLGVSVAGYRAANQIGAGKSAMYDASPGMAQEELAAENAGDEPFWGIAADERADAEEQISEAGSPASDGNGSSASGSTPQNHTNELTNVEAYKDNLEEKRTEMCSLPKEDGGTVMTPEQVRALDVVGDYFPAVLPGDGEISVLCGRDIQGQEMFTMGWNADSKSESSGRFYVQAENLGDTLPDRVKNGIADMSQPETYDHNRSFAVFREEDFAKECVEARLVSNPEGESGSGLPKGTFGVLYEEGGAYVLVTFDGEGTAEDVWEMLSSVKAGQGAY